MAVWCFGSINSDIFYQVPHIPRPGETIAGMSRTTGLGGKGANQSVAAARAGSVTYHLGAVGADGEWAVERLRSFCVETSGIARVDVPTGHAIIPVADDGENAIIIYGGANQAQSPLEIKASLQGAKAGDIFLLQNEVSHQVEIAKFARDIGLRVMYSAAPFDVKAVRTVLECCEAILVNEIEAAQLLPELDVDLLESSVKGLLVTLGSNGAEWRDLNSGEVTKVNAYPVDAVDSTGAGDTFAGYFAAGLDQGLKLEKAMDLASAAAALMVTRPGTSDVIPSREEVLTFQASVRS